MCMHIYIDSALQAQTEKTKRIIRTVNRETGVCRHHMMAQFTQLSFLKYLWYVIHKFSIITMTCDAKREIFGYNKKIRFNVTFLLYPRTSRIAYIDSALGEKHSRSSGAEKRNAEKKSGHLLSS